MARPERLTDPEIEQLLEAAPGWERRDDTLFRAIRFANFQVAFGFMTQMAILADKIDHHPEWFNVYNRVEITMTTHDADGITELDRQFVEAANAAADALGGE